MRLYKFLRTEGRSPFSGFAWPLVTGQDHSDWVAAERPLIPCRRGFHAVAAEGLADWLAEELWEVELDGEILVQNSTLVGERARLLRRIPRWPAPVADQFADDCIDRIRGLLERERTIDRSNAVATLEGYAADAAEYRELDNVPAVAYITAHAADVASPEPGRRLDRDVTQFALERARQSAWLVDALALQAPG